MKYSTRIQHNFNRAALTYDQHSPVQQQVGITLLQHLLPLIQGEQMIIDLGCGTGWMTAHLAKQMGYKNFYALDNSELLLSQAKLRLANTAIQFLCADFDQYLPNGPGSTLIFANMSLQWSNNLLILLHKLYQQLMPKGILAFSLPLANTLKELPSHNHFYTIVEMQQLLQQQAWQLLISTTSSIPLKFSSGLAALRSLKRAGVHSKKQNTRSRQKVLWNWRRRKACTLSYEIGYFIMRKS